MILITYRGGPSGRYPFFLWKQHDGYLCRLREVDVSVNSRGLAVSEPYYEALFTVEKHPGSADLFATIRGHLVDVSVTRKWPWLKVFIFKEDD